MARDGIAATPVRERFRLGPVDLELNESGGVVFAALRNREVPGGPGKVFASWPVGTALPRELFAIGRCLRERGLHREAGRE